MFSDRRLIFASIALASVFVAALVVDAQVDQSPFLKSGRLCLERYRDANGQGRWPVTFYGLMGGNPGPGLQRAAETWSGAGSALRYFWGGSTYAEIQDLRLNNQEIHTIVDTGHIVGDPIAIAHTSEGRHHGDTRYPDCYYQTYIIANDELYWNNRFAFWGNPTSLQYDWESVMVHELGHIWGSFEDTQGNVSTTVMHPRIGLGQIRRQLDQRDVDRVRMKYPLGTNGIP